MAIDFEGIDGSSGADSISVDTSHPQQADDTLVIHGNGGSDTLAINRAGSGRIDVYGDAGADLISIKPLGGSADVRVMDYDETAGDRLRFAAPSGALTTADLRLAGATDDNITLQARWSGTWHTVGRLDNAKTSDSVLDGDGVADAVTQAALDAMLARMITASTVTV
ncbi:hypothetical protein [Azospirillum soli]|uniref:hypothetical protein n=1 Tax=Azospirillum soli TaxID=1304799 RepID=UPI001AE7C775|nr:hypothetical protein [Azospirillum soli]MBP2315529.1 hypothetical protein [Azospirillum soli]